MGYKTIEEEETEGKSTVDSKATKVGTEVFSESGTGKATQSGYQAGASFGGK